MLLVWQLSITQYSGLSSSKGFASFSPPIPTFLCFSVPQSLSSYFLTSWCHSSFSTNGLVSQCIITLCILKKKPTLFFSWMDTKTSWLILMIDARHILCDPIKLCHSDLVVLSVTLLTSHNSAEVQKYVWNMGPKYSDPFRTELLTLGLKDASVLSIKAVKSINVILPFWLF